MNTIHLLKKGALYTIGFGAFVLVSLAVTALVDIPNSDWLLTQQGLMWNI